MHLNHVINVSEAQIEGDSSADAIGCSVYNKKPETEMEDIEDKRGTANTTYRDKMRVVNYL